MLCKCHWIVLYTVHFTAFCLGGGRFFPDTVYVCTTHQHQVVIRRFTYSSCRSLSAWQVRIIAFPHWSRRKWQLEKRADPEYFVTLSVRYSVIADGRWSCRLSGPYMFLLNGLMLNIRYNYAAVIELLSIGILRWWLGVLLQNDICGVSVIHWSHAEDCRCCDRRQRWAV